MSLKTHPLSGPVPPCELLVPVDDWLLRESTGVVTFLGASRGLFLSLVIVNRSCDCILPGSAKTHIIAIERPIQTLLRMSEDLNSEMTGCLTRIDSLW